VCFLVLRRRSSRRWSWTGRSTPSLSSSCCCCSCRASVKRPLVCLVLVVLLVAPRKVFCRHSPGPASKRPLPLFTFVRPCQSTTRKSLTPSLCPASCLEAVFLETSMILSSSRSHLSGPLACARFRGMISLACESPCMSRSYCPLPHSYGWSWRVPVFRGELSRFVCV